MKKTSYKTIVLFSMLLFMLLGCTKDFEDINTNPNQPTSVPTEYLLTNAEFRIMDFIWDEWWNGRQGLVYSQYWSQTAYTEESRFEPRVNVTNNYWSYFYTNMMDLEQIIIINTDEDTKGPAAASGPNENQIAVARIMKAFTFQMMTDIWGDIPYFDALKGIDNISPSYSKQQDIYTDLLKELTEAQAMIVDGDINGDVIYGGDMTKWKKFANSLRMRVALRTSKVNPDYMAEIQAAITAGAFESYEDDAYFMFDSKSPGYNPLYEAAIVSGRPPDFAVSEPLISLLVETNDPRLPLYADPAAKFVDDPVPFRGLAYGLSATDAPGIAGPGGENVSLPSLDIVLAPAAKGWMMTYGEVCFIKSEIMGWDQSEYEKGIEASMLTWGVAADEVSTYLSTVAPASAETVGTQKWIGMYMQGNQGWFEWRRTGYPMLEGPEAGPLGDIGNRIIASRLFYPSREQVVNGEQYDAAVVQFGADQLYTRVWWDKE